jgi:hypothetical protein
MQCPRIFRDVVETDLGRGMSGMMEIEVTLLVGIAHDGDLYGGSFGHIRLMYTYPSTLARWRDPSGMCLKDQDYLKVIPAIFRRSCPVSDVRSITSRMPSVKRVT